MYLFQNKNTMVASKMGLLRRTAKWNLWYMNVGLVLDFGCPLLFLFYVYRCDICQITLCLTDFVTEQDGLQFMSRLSTVTFSVLVNRPPTGIFSIIGVWVKWIVGARGGILFWFPGGKGNWDFTLLYSYRYPISSSCGDVQLSFAIFVVCFFALRLPN